MVKIAYLRTTSIINDSRANKEINTYAEQNNFVYVFGWDRQNLNKDKLQNCDNIQFIMYNQKSNYGDGVKNIFKLLKFELWLHKNLKKMINEIDVIHACDFDTAYIGYKIARKYNKKFIYDIYDYYVDCHNLYFLKRFIENIDISIINRSDVVILCTEQRSEQIKKSQPKRIEIIHNTPDIKKKYIATKFDEKNIKICYVGILQDDRLLIEIGNSISKYPNVELHIGGFGKYENFFENLSQKNKNVFFYGQMKYDDVLNLESKCDVLFATYNPDVPNHKYSAPNKVYEAMALGKPIVVCKNTGVDQLVQNEHIGYVINYDAKDFFNCIEKISAGEYENISKVGKYLYCEKYKWDVMKEKMKKIINDIEVK